ncbi:MAG: hypothetical protein ACLT63_04495 [Bacteroides xylanisolvens]
MSIKKKRQENKDLDRNRANVVESIDNVSGMMPNGGRLEKRSYRWMKENYGRYDFWGYRLYNVLGGKGAMKGYMENWVGDRDMPKDIGGWQNGQKAYHIRFMNKKGVDILHLKYSKSAANTLVDKYNRLFFNREK